MTSRVKDYLLYIDNQRFGDVIARELGTSDNVILPQCSEVYANRQRAVERWTNGIASYDPKIGMFMEGFLFGIWLANQKGKIIP